MTQKTEAQRNAEKTVAAARALSRRSVLKGAVLAGLLIAGPFVVNRRVLASSGDLNLLMWSDYLPPGLIADFETKTGIKVNYTGIGSNEEIIAQMKASGGRGFDICSPTNMRAPQWEDLDLLQPFDTRRIAKLDNLNPAMLRVGDRDWNFGNRGSHWVPHIWGTEAISWRTDKWQPKDGPNGLPSYGDIWDPAVKGKTMMRLHSGMLGAGLYLEVTGVLEPGDMRRAYESEDAMRPVWNKVTKFCIDHKDQVKLFWNDADSQKNGFLTEGVVVGQTWDGPPTALKNAGEPVMYRAPKERRAGLDRRHGDTGRGGEHRSALRLPGPRLLARAGGQGNRPARLQLSGPGRRRLRQRHLCQELRRGLPGRLPGQPLALAERAAVVRGPADRVPRQVPGRLSQGSSTLLPLEHAANLGEHLVDVFVFEN